MRSTSRMPVWASILAAATAAGLLAVAGCTLDKPENQPQQVFNRIGRRHGGQVLQPRQCLVRVLILDRPFRDPAINEVVWRIADEQVVAPAERKALAANGLRSRPDHRRAAQGARDDPQGRRPEQGQGRARRTSCSRAGSRR